jgi:hypothetical protein
MIVSYEIRDEFKKLDNGWIKNNIEVDLISFEEVGQYLT